MGGNEVQKPKDESQSTTAVLKGLGMAGVMARSLIIGDVSKALLQFLTLIKAIVNYNLSKNASAPSAAPAPTTPEVKSTDTPDTTASKEPPAPRTPGMSAGGG